jgi:hypothetical protein
MIGAERCSCGLGKKRGNFILVKQPIAGELHGRAKRYFVTKLINMRTLMQRHNNLYMTLSASLPACGIEKYVEVTQQALSRKETSVVEK